MHEVRRKLSGSLPFHVGPRHAQAIRLGSKCLHPLSHLTMVNNSGAHWKSQQLESRSKRTEFQALSFTEHVVFLYIKSTGEMEETFQIKNLMRSVVLLRRDHLSSAV